MRNAARAFSASVAVKPVFAGLAIWNRRLLLVATLAILWGATVLALHAVGPDVREIIAGEGMMIGGSD